MDEENLNEDDHLLINEPQLTKNMTHNNVTLPKLSMPTLRMNSFSSEDDQFASVIETYQKKLSLNFNSEEFKNEESIIV